MPQQVNQGGRKRRFVLAVGGVVAALTLAACGSSSKAAAPSTTASSSSTAATSSSTKHYHFELITKSNASPYWLAVKAGADAAAKKFGDTGRIQPVVAMNLPRWAGHLGPARLEEDVGHG